ncbi:LysE family translocator [Alginatibacterium sediminis]|uniref:LysE family translocator n=1 Tax=Alginatibacterium sediminis TaxID=2164068 RepID=A0A420EBK4_9ALTE|nr:LysE family translocator [Alginatibacterium sediminis]RKF18051.1 LysE family translocator [Alginatibacterium sediminis]
MDLHSIALFVVASLALNLIPGPDVVYIVSNTMKANFRAGIMAALGLGLGYFVHTLAAVLGLSALILSSAIAFGFIKYLGAAYLLYLGLCAISNMLKGSSSFSIPNSSTSERGVFKQGLIVSILNPKVGLFFLSFLPQFVDLSSDTASGQLLLLGLVFTALATVCNLLYALVGSLLFSNPKVSGYARCIEGCSGALLIGLAGKIAFSKSV